MDNRISYFLKGIIVAVIAVLLSNCSQGRILLEGERGAAAIGVYERSHDYRQNVKGIPPGHMPPPGSCRIWYPGTPPGQQPPPGDCYILSQRVPPHAWLIRG